MKPSNPWLTAARYGPDLFDCLSLPRDNSSCDRLRVGYDFAGRPKARKSANLDHGPIPPGIAILHRIAPFIGKGIVIGCAVYALKLAVIG